MSTCKQMLKDLEYYSMVEDGLEAKKDANRKEYNFRRIMNELKEKRQDEAVAARYDANIAKAKALVESFGIVHNTTLDSVISTIQNGALLSIDEMEKRDISFNFRISFRGINDEMHKYVFASTHKGDAIYGLFELKFKKAVETSKAIFTPKSYLEYGNEVLRDYFIDIKNWRTYLAEYIATTLDNPNEFISTIPVHQRPEFLFQDQVSIDDVEKIVCASKKSALELVKRIKKEFGEDNKYLELIKVSGE